MDIFYSPSQFNRAFAAKMESRGGFPKSTRFVPLASRNEESIARELSGLAGRAAFIWEGGGTHHYSYYFTKSSGASAKLNFDGHGDAVPTKRLQCGSHMHFSERDGNETYTVGSRLALDYAHSIASRHGRIAVTVDCDVLKNFPAHAQWINYGDFGPSAEDIAGFVSLASGRVLRLDIGGIVDTSHDLGSMVRNFKTVKDPLKPPEDLEAYTFARALEGTADPAQILDWHIVDRVLGYAFSAYSEILQAFVKSQIISRR